MSTFIKNKKIFLLLPILFIVFSFFLIVSSRADCNDKCGDCDDPGECSASFINCRWDSNRNKCYGALEVDWPLSPGGTVLNRDSDVGDMVQYFYEWAIALGGLATFFSLVLGGFKYLSSMGRPEAMKEAKEQITSAFAGLVLLLSAWLILNVINPDLTTFKRTSYNLKYLMENPAGINLNELPGCDYVKLYPRESFGGAPLEIKPGINILTGEDGYYEVGVGKAGSVKSFSKSTLEEFGCTTPDCECEGHACGCALELYAEGYDEETKTVLPCGDKLGEVPAWDKDLLSHEGEAQEINCVRLSGIACKCRDRNDKGECTTTISPDSVWGDNEHNCVGTNELMNNTRCLEGKCITCKGTILKDGCGGCSNDVLVPGYTGTSEFACWYAGIKSSDGASCNSSCDRYAGEDASCVKANWNDYNNCTVCHTLTSAGGCMPTTWWGAPWIVVDVLDWNWGSDCFYRGSIPNNLQKCGDLCFAHGRRLCVCDR